MSTYQEDVKRVQAMSDEAILSCWRAMWIQPDRNIYGNWWEDTQPSEEWAEVVYSEMGRRGLSGDIKSSEGNKLNTWDKCIKGSFFLFLGHKSVP